jgi:hypothetical protein
MMNGPPIMVNDFPAMMDGPPTMANAAHPPVGGLLAMQWNSSVHTLPPSGGRSAALAQPRWLPRLVRAAGPRG